MTGIEQYSLERAGYFVRRKLVTDGTNADDLLSTRGIAEVIFDLSRGFAKPNRTCTLDESVRFQRRDANFWPLAETAGYFVVVALGEVDELYLSPGSHIAPQEELTRVRLGVGDVLFLINGVVGEVRSVQTGMMYEFYPQSQE